MIIATPNSTTYVDKNFAMALMALQKPEKWRMLMPSVLPVGAARNEVFRKAREAKEEWILFLDYDNTFPPDIIDILMKVHESTGADLTGGVYFEQGWPNYPVLGNINKDLFSYRVALQDEVLKEGSVFVCDVIGMGCSLVHTPKFFEYPDDWFGYTLDDKKWDTEDMRAFVLMKQRGITVAATTCGIGHSGTYIFGAHDWALGRKVIFEKYSEQQQKTNTGLEK